MRRVDPLAERLADGDRRALARAITLAESTRPEHRRRAAGIVEQLRPMGRSALRVGISGPPGVGKSTFIESVGASIIGEGHHLAVLAIDPSSSTTGGSILGDKTRMPTLAQLPQAFIRPSPTSGVLGGVATRTADAIALCEAAGFDVVFVETVGVGQSETMVADMTDVFVLLVTPGGGDDLQGIKRGVMELTDMVVVNKADGDMADQARITAGDYERAFHIVRPKRPDLPPIVTTSSSHDPERVIAVWHAIESFGEQLAAAGYLESTRAQQQKKALDREIRRLSLLALETDPELASLRAELEGEVADGRTGGGLAALRFADALTARMTCDREDSV
jgi:LAO/AO transport system kinase